MSEKNNTLTSHKMIWTGRIVARSGLLIYVDQEQLNCLCILCLVEPWPVCMSKFRNLWNKSLEREKQTGMQTDRQTDRQTDNDKVAQDLTNHILHISKPEEVSFSPILKTIGDQKEKIPLNWWQHVSQWHNFNDVNQQIQKVQFNGWSRKETKGKMWFLHMCTRGSFASLKS